MSRKEAMEYAAESLKEVGLESKIFRAVSENDERRGQQRVAIARARHPVEIPAGRRADRKSGSENEEHIVQLLLKLAHEMDYVVIVSDT